MCQHRALGVHSDSCLGDINIRITALVRGIRIVFKKDTINFAPVRSVLAGVISSCDHVGTQYKLNGLEVYSTGAMSPERKPDSRRPMNRKRVNKEVKRLSSQHRVSRLKLEAAWSPLLVAAIVDSLQASLPSHPCFLKDPCSCMRSIRSYRS